MSTEKLVEDLAKQIDRRTFLGQLGKLGVGLVGGLVGLMALPETAAAVSYKCCTLCRSPSSTCRGCACAWCWTCNHNGQKWRCCECHSSGSYCGGRCRNIKCSRATRIS